MLLPFYLDGIYLSTLQQQARLWQLNYYLSLWFTQMCLCRFYFPLLLRLENDVETNPVDQRSGPRPPLVLTSCFHLLFSIEKERKFLYNIQV